MTDAELKTFIQSSSEQELLVQHSTYLIEGYLYNADLIANKLIELKPQNGNYLYRKGYTTLEALKDYEKAIELFEKAKVEISNNYDIFSTKEQRAPADVYFHLATAYHLTEKIDKAEEAYKTFLDLSKKKSELVPVTQLRLLQCTEAKKWMSNPVSIKLKNMGSAINSKAPEYSPVVSMDGSAIYFTSRRFWENGEANGDKDIVRRLPPEDVYVSYLDFENEWTEPKRLLFCSPTRNEATSAVSTDERKVYLYLDSTGGGDIYTTDFYKARFNEIQYLEIKNINTKYWESHCMVSHDNSRIFFVSNRLGGFGGRDLYYIDLLADGSWSDPINMGPKINTPYDEDAPFISIDNKILYYSTNGPKSIGGFDIMKTTMLADGSWTEGMNLGYPFNSTNDDIFYTTTVDGLKGYMTSHRKNGFGEKDIYEIQNDFLGVQNIAVLKGNIKMADGSAIGDDVVVLVNLKCLNCEGKSHEERTVFPRARDGFYLSGLEPCKDYQIDYQNISQSLTIYKEFFTTPCDTGYLVIEKDLLLNPDYTVFRPIADPIIADTETTIIPVVAEVTKNFSNLEFKQYLGFNKNNLDTKNGELGVFLKQIEQQLKDGREEITIRVFASASTVPTQSFKSNELLANKRASNVEQTLNDYFAKSKYQSKVKIEIVEAIVQGPEYSGDFDNEEKYGPFQYVALYTR
jgi:tetratricopeptide (TPR) repeat protein